MDTADDDELRRLSARAYGPDADIHRDPAAMARLHELLDGRRERGLEAVRVDEPEEAAEPPLAAPEPVTVAAETEKRTPWIRDFVRSRRGRYTLLWAATLVAVLAVAGAAVTMVERVQTSPLASEAVQLARLNPDPAISELAGFFGSRGFEQGSATAFELFDGLRVIAAPEPYLSQPGRAAWCLYVMPTQTYETATDSSLSGPMWTGCSAGGFPAMVQMLVPDSEEFAGAAFVDRPLQFVYDDAHGEVVVFADR